MLDVSLVHCTLQLFLLNLVSMTFNHLIRLLFYNLLRAWSLSVSQATPTVPQAHPAYQQHGVSCPHNLHPSAFSPRPDPGPLGVLPRQNHQSPLALVTLFTVSAHTAVLPDSYQSSCVGWNDTPGGTCSIQISSLFSQLGLPSLPSRASDFVFRLLHLL